MNRGKAVLKKPEWDSSTFNDIINQMKPVSVTTQERRRASATNHQQMTRSSSSSSIMSKNKMPQQRNVIQAKSSNAPKSLIQNKSSIKQTNNDAMKNLALLKGILMEDEQLRNLILKSDNTLKTVQSFFENDENDEVNSISNGKKKQVKINMTLAPNVTNLNDSNLPIPQETKQKLAKQYILSNSVKINNVNDVDSDSENRNTSELRHQEANQIDDDMQSIKSKNYNQYNKNQDPSKFSQWQSSTNQQANPNSLTLELFEKTLNELEAKIKDFEKQTGKRQHIASSLIADIQTNSNSSLNNQTGYSIILIKIMTSLIDYVKDILVDANFEKLKLVETSKQLEINRKLIDGLTNELLSVKEQNEMIVSGFINQQAKMEAEVEQIKIMLRSSTLASASSFNNKFAKPQPLGLAHTFNSQSQTNLDLLNYQRNNLIQQQQQQQNHQLQDVRPASCLSMFNLNSNNPQSYDQNGKSNDTFAERCAELLNTKRISQSSIFNMSSENSRKNSLMSNNTFSSTMNNNKQIFNDFTSQIQELSFKNVEAQEKLRRIQDKKQSINNIISNTNLSADTGNNSSSTAKLDADVDKEPKNYSYDLERLKKDQLLLREQIEMLNRERESAQRELYVLESTNSKNAATNSNKIVDNNIDQQNFIKQFHETNNSNFDINLQYMSPIKPDK